MKTLRIMAVLLAAGTLMSSAVIAQTPDNQLESQLLQRVDQDQDKINQAVNSGTITQEQADADNKRISDVRAQISKTHKKYHGVIPHKNLVSINKTLGNLESKEKSQEKHKPQ